ncbi:hypothetical protein ACNKHK_24345 [Shigella flexneri]
MTNRYRFGQASRISGVTPAAISILLVWLKKTRYAASQRLTPYKLCPISDSASGNGSFTGNDRAQQTLLSAG